MQMTDELKVRGVRSHGFGQLAKAAMLDSDLSLESRAILAYLPPIRAAETLPPSREETKYLPTSALTRIHIISISKP